MEEEDTHKKEAVEVELPEEISIQVLSRLPVKSLLKFKTVRKSWYSIINSKQFIKEHLNHAHSTQYCNDQHKNLLGLIIPNMNSNRCVLYKEYPDDIIRAKECFVPFHVERVCNYCDGLICFNMSGNGILIWNPSLPLEYKIIPLEYKMKSLSKLDDFLVGMGYDSTTDDYKIVRVPYTNSRHSFVEVFSLKSGSWSKREISKKITYMIQHKMSIYTSNGLHWCGSHFDGGLATKFIVYFDMVEERLDYVNIPVTFDHMFDYKDSFAMAGHNALWVLVDYNGMKSSWNKIFQLPERKYLDIEHIPFCYRCFTRDGKILVQPWGHGLRTYDPKDGSVKNVMIPEDYNNIMNQKVSLAWFYASPYFESLVSPKWMDG